MSDPITLAVAAAIAGTAAESLGKQAGPAVVALARRIRERLTARSEKACTAIEAVRAAPQDPDRIVELATVVGTVLDREATDDPDLQADVRALRHQVQQFQAAATDDAVVNSFQGNADKVVQLRDLHGDLNIS
ncbi:MAG: hypothetical protein GEV11_07745 [Streptosporangiales bacterium]|nr:hypothetical protein [Streptosporangiales bacterium]